MRLSAERNQTLLGVPITKAKNLLKVWERNHWSSPLSWTARHSQVGVEPRVAGALLAEFHARGFIRVNVPPWRSWCKHEITELGREFYSMPLRKTGETAPDMDFSQAPAGRLAPFHVGMLSHIHDDALLPGGLAQGLAKTELAYGRSRSIVCAHQGEWSFGSSLKKNPLHGYELDMADGEGTCAIATGETDDWHHSDKWGRVSIGKIGSVFVFARDVLDNGSEISIQYGLISSWHRRSSPADGAVENACWRMFGPISIDVERAARVLLGRGERPRVRLELFEGNTPDHKQADNILGGFSNRIRSNIADLERSARPQRPRRNDTPTPDPKPAPSSDVDKLFEHGSRKLDPLCFDYGFETLGALLTSVNDRLVAAGRRPMPQGDVPTNAGSFRRFVKLYREQLHPEETPRPCL